MSISTSFIAVLGDHGGWDRGICGDSNESMREVGEEGEDGGEFLRAVIIPAY